jgi:MFS family permease
MSFLVRRAAWISVPRQGREFEKWWILLLLWWDYFLLYIHRNDIFFVFPLLRKELVFDEFQLGMVGTVFQWGYALVSPFVGYLGDRIDRRTILIWSALLSAFVTIGIGMSHSPGQIIFLRVLLAVTQAASVPAAVGLIADLHTTSTRSTAVGIYLTSPFAGLLISGVLGGYLAQHFGWRFSFIVFGGLGLIMTFALYLFLRRRGDTLAEHGASQSSGWKDFWPVIREVLSTRTCVALAIVCVLDGIVRLTITTWLPVFFFDKFSLNLAGAGSLSTQYIQPASAFGVLIGGRLGDWSAQKNVRGRILVQAAGLMGMTPALYMMGFSSSVVVLSWAMVGYGLALGLNQANIWPSTFQVLPPSSRSTAVGLLNCAGGVLGGWVPAAAGEGSLYVGMGTIVAMLSTLSLLSSVICVLTAFWFLPRESTRWRGIS